MSEGFIVEEIGDAELRRLREAIYGPQTETNWENCRALWREPKNLQWLIDHQPESAPSRRRLQTQGTR